MSARILDGVAIAAEIQLEVRERTAKLVARGIVPNLTVLLVGEDPASQIYVRSKNRACHEAGMASATITLPADTPEAELLARIDRLNADASVHGILCQMPLPSHIDADKVLRRIDPAKDVDGFHPMNVGKLVLGDPTAFLPATPAGIQEILRRSDISTRGARAVVVGRSTIVGRPMANLLLQPGPGGDATVTVCHSRTRDLPAICREADLLVVAIGRAHFLGADAVQPGATVIDVGINRIADPSAKKGYRVVGDVDFDAVREIAGAITPVPGGVGRMTIAMVLQNTLLAAERQA
ncbi:MAG TPA: bifunctional 5,10-methylenetetrahydrofolate dehydrogenase/5,10-methenyltetrahydrofolate cyclohydrolase [Gemmatimonadales bacterium]|nr:bifunctional 5,10-methylenetetrahydrofolate dehydrogenase/5,10-methenyltetrahydrofolate cyclohydrolase [Gemmatimonadales bacterium]HPF62666.1 bifunctional 5,10-methylenetetrahydrofolate dehydrogenase/5,10-methenyltetrahydrofolate cyclohydrolase [Gemmatimonadales bacterium]